MLAGTFPSDVLLICFCITTSCILLNNKWGRAQQCLQLDLVSQAAVPAAGEQQPAVWQMLEEWGAEGSCWGGPLLQALQRCSEPSWRVPVDEEVLLGGLDEGQALIQELH